MLIDMNGMSFHLHLSQTASAQHLNAAIVDESFQADPMRKSVDGLSALLRMIENYSGIAPPPEVCDRLADHFAQQDRAA